jgi:hypothetical protein
MKALALVPKFQEKLEIPKKEAISRVIRFFLLSACFVAVVVLVTTFFPYAASFTEEFVLLPGNHIQVEEILDGEVLLGEDQFLQKAEGSATFVALGEEAIVYMTKVAGISYRHDQTAPTYFNYYISSQKIQDGVALREMARIRSTMVFVWIVLPLIVLFALFMATLSAQWRDVSGKWKKVWF